MKIKSKLIPLTSLFVVGMLLVMAVGTLAAPGDPAFTLVGLISTITPGTTYAVKGQSFQLESPNVCSPPSPCPPADLTLVEVKGYINATVYYATTITVQLPATIFTYTGVLNSVSDTAWGIGAYIFNVSTTTVLPPFKAVGDTVVATYTVEAGTGVYLAKEIKILVFGVGNSYEGELKEFTDTTWTVGDFTFTLENVVLPPYFGIQDIVEVTFKIVNGQLVATAVRVVETFVPFKTESERCENRVKDHPGVLKLAADVNEDPVKIMEYFCLGFGLGEIKNAYKHAEGSQYTPGMLLALRSGGLGWGEVKKMARNLPAVDDVDETTPDSGDKVKDKDKLKNQNQDKTNNGQGADKDKTNNGNGSDKDKSNNGKNK